MNKQIESLNERYGATKFKLDNEEASLEQLEEEMFIAHNKMVEVNKRWAEAQRRRADAMEELVGLARELASLTIGRD